MLSTYVGTYVARHLVKLKATAIHCTSPDGLTVVDGVLTLIAANGDELYGTYDGYVTSVDLPFIGYSADHQFADGTGRFAGATVKATEVGTVNAVTGTGSSTFEGEFTYNASQRRA